jgi:hypothetical protein
VILDFLRANHLVHLHYRTNINSSVQKPIES